MSTLLSADLLTELSHEIRLTTPSRIHIAAFLPYLMMFNAPSGTFTFSLLEGATTLFSKSFTCDDIKSSLGATENYAHVFYPIIPPYLVQLKSGVYAAKITASGYTASESAYLGWIKQYENNQNEMEYTIETDVDYPLALRIKIYEDGIQ